MMQAQSLATQAGAQGPMRMMVQPDVQFRGMLGGFRALVAAQGVRGLFRGGTAAALRVSGCAVCHHVSTPP